MIVLIGHFKNKGNLLLFCFVFGCAAQRLESQFPDEDSNLFPLLWKCGVLTTGPQESYFSKHVSLRSLSRNVEIRCFFSPK